MSLRAMLWALHDAPCKDPIDKLILWSMSDQAADDGHGIYLSVQSIADTVPCDRATVQRHLRSLEAAGIIVKGDQAAAQHLRADRRPTVYDLPLPGRTVRPRPMLRGRTDPLDGAAHGAAQVRPDPKTQEITHNPRTGGARGRDRHEIAAEIATGMCRLGIDTNTAQAMRAMDHVLGRTDLEVGNPVGYVLAAVKRDPRPFRPTLSPPPVSQVLAEMRHA